LQVEYARLVMNMQLEGCVYGGEVSDTVPDPELPDPELQDPELQYPVHAEAIVRVDIDAAPDDVWQALTTDDGLSSWLGDGSTIGDDVGDEIHVNDLVTGQRKRGVLDEVTPGHRLGYTWWPETSPGDATRVAISLEPIHTGTRITVVESRPMAATGSVACTPLAVAMAGVATDWAWRTALLTVWATRTMPVLELAGPSRGCHGR